MELFSGGGDLGALIRQKDWSTTPLGPISSWPQSLKTSLSLILSSHHPMWIGWGKHATFLYNDAYIPVLSLAKHPWALGRPAEEVWAEIWDVCGPLADKVFQHNTPSFVEEVRLFMNRGDFVEETYYSFSYSPIHDESGNVGGLFCPSAEVTARVLNARRLRTLSELAANALVERSTSAACVSAMHTLGKNLDDIPFGLLYLLHEDRRALVATVGTFEDADQIDWAIEEVASSAKLRLVSLSPEIRSKVKGVPVGIANQSVNQAVVLPLVPRGGDLALGALVVGVNPARRMDEEYRTFFELVAGQITNAIQNARSAEEEKQRADKLAEIDRAKTTFFSNVSHEFRTPLTLLIGPTEDALASPARALTGHALESVYRNELRLMKLVNSLLDFSRIEAGRAQATFVESDLSKLTRELASVFQSATDSAGLELVLDCDPLPKGVFVDRDMWEKIVLNLVSNALKFTFDGKIEVGVRVVEKEDGERVAELRVIDTGSGIPEPELPRLFERFHRVEGARARTHEGSGIGLALVQELVHMHGGVIGVESKLGVGTAFRVSIPFGSTHLPKEHVANEAAKGNGDGALNKATQTQAFAAEASRWLDAPSPSLTSAAQQQKRHAAAGDGVGRGETPRGQPSVEPFAANILVADDNMDMREYITRLLADHWSIEAVPDGQAALQKLNEKPFDIVLTDVMMPNLDGYGLLKAIRADKRLKNVAVIMLSARAGDESSVDGLKAGADDYLVKPFSARELIARIRTRLEIGRTRREAEAARARLYAQFMQAPVPVSTVVGPEFRYELANPKYIEMIGGREVVGKTFREAFPELPDDAPVLEMLRGVYTTGKAFKADEYHVQLDRTGAGILEDAYFQFTCQPFLNADNAIEGIMTASIDVTEQVKSRKQLESARLDAESANRSKDEFLAMLGHELRNPLSPIVTALQLLQLKGLQHRELAIIARQVQHVTRLVDDLLDVSRITRGKVELRKERVEMARVVVRAIEMSSPLIEQRRQVIDVDVPAEGLVVDADPDRLAQVISNLLTNASKYSEVGSKILVTASRKNNLAHLSVRDQGIGLPPEMIDRVFDLFVQQPQALDRAKGGLGLGLAIVRSLVELHGGTVRVTSDGPGRGSEFVVDLPFADATSNSPERASPLPLNAESLANTTNADANANATKERILVVDDNLDSAEMIGVLLTHLGYDVRTVNDPLEAIKVAEEVNPTVCLLDIGLPVMSGYELAQRIRQSTGAVRNAKLIAVTGYSQEADRQRSEEAGFNAHVVKPVSLEILAKALKD